jgi:LacI family transcriptional regulator
MSPIKDRKASITMYEIARLAGVSQSTVSRVLNGSAVVASDKRDAVLRVMEELNYRPNAAAQELVSGKTYTIGVLTRHLGSPYFGEILRGIAQGIQSSSYYPIIALGGEMANEDIKALELLLARRVDGLILQVSKQLSDEYLYELAGELPLVLIGRQIPHMEKQCVTINNIKGAYMATAYLIDKGHTMIAHIGGRFSLIDAIERRQGFQQAMADNGLEVIPELIVEGDFGEASGTWAVDTLLSRRKKYPFTAIFIANDQMALGANLGLFNRQVNVPNEISLIGFDDLPPSQYMTPPLTSIRQPAHYMGVVGAQAILTMLSGERFTIPDLPLELVIRQSVAIIPR